MRAFILFLLAASAAFAQAEPRVITVTASRQLNIQPDQVSLTVDINSDANQTLASVLTFLKGTKIAAGDLSNFYTLTGSYPEQREWIFTPTVSFSDLGGVVAALAALPTLSTTAPITLWYFYLNATASPQALAGQPCPYPALISDAETQASKLAAAAGGTLGPIVSLGQGNGSGVVDRLGLVTIYDPYTVPEFAVTNPCTLTVQFKLGQ